MTTPTDEEVLAAWQLVVSTAATAADAEVAFATADAANRAAALDAGAARAALFALILPEGS